jgi:DNA-binding transcriptional LysR family regulator
LDRERTFNVRFAPTAAVPGEVGFLTQSGIDIRLTIGNTAQGAAALHEGGADLAFIEGIIEDPMLTKEQVARDQLVIVVGTEHAWSATDSLEPDRLIETDWVLREPGSGIRSTFEAALQGFGVSPGALPLALELPILTCAVVPSCSRVMIVVQ